MNYINIIVILKYNEADMTEHIHGVQITTFSHHKRQLF